ncbi:MAG: alpha/beta fold hydrolase [Frankiaceae bacterium]
MTERGSTEAPGGLRDLPGPGRPPVPPWPGEIVRAGRHELLVRRGPGGAAGPGRPLAVLVHGLGGASTNWTDLMQLLGDRVSAVAPDLPGFGLSPPPPRGDYRLAVHVDAVERLVEEVAGGPVHLFGNSLGGAVATRLAARRPDLVTTLTLISPALPDLRPRRGTDWRLGVLLVPGLARAGARWLARRPATSRARAIAELCLADPDRLPPERVEEAVAELERRRGLAWNDESLIRSLRGLVAAHLVRGPGSLWGDAASVRAPTLLVWGRQDRLVHPSVGERAARTFPAARLLVLDRCGHVAQIEDPVAVARAWLGLVAAG